MKTDEAGQTWAEDCRKLTDCTGLSTAGSCSIEVRLFQEHMLNSRKSKALGTQWPLKFRSQICNNLLWFYFLWMTVRWTGSCFHSDLVRKWKSVCQLMLKGFLPWFSMAEGPFCFDWWVLFPATHMVWKYIWKYKINENINPKLFIGALPKLLVFAGFSSQEDMRDWTCIYWFSVSELSKRKVN